MIGLSFLHKIIDGTTISCFIKSSAASNDGALEKLACGSYEASSSLFPPREISSGYSVISPETPFLVAHGKHSSCRRFVFDAMAVSNLKVRARSQSVSNPTSVEAVTCFIWKYAMKAASTCKSLGKDNRFVFIILRFGYFFDKIISLISYDLLVGSSTLLRIIYEEVLISILQDLFRWKWKFQVKV